jgi:hydroxyacylglutathione hydrolase
LLNVKQYRYGNDNFGYLVYGSREALVIDGGAYEEILGFIKNKKLNLRFITNTHNHHDHTIGNNYFTGNPQSRILKYKELITAGEIDLDGQKIKFYDTPGHTDDSICFHAGNILISGDTLFNGTIGNCFTGDLEAFYRTVKMLMRFPPETIIYAGHDYVKDSMQFAKNLEPDNNEIDIFLSRYDRNYVFSTMRDEFTVNPFMRFNDEKIISILKKKGLPTETEWDRWHSLMSIE